MLTFLPLTPISEPPFWKHPQELGLTMRPDGVLQRPLPSLPVHVYRQDTHIRYKVARMLRPERAGLDLG